MRTPAVSQPKASSGHGSTSTGHTQHPALPLLTWAQSREPAGGVIVACPLEGRAGKLEEPTTQSCLPNALVTLSAHILQY